VTQPPADPWQAPPPGYPQPVPTQPAVPAPWQPVNTPAPWQPVNAPPPYYPGPTPPAKRRVLLIASIVVVLLVVVGGAVAAGGYLLTRDRDGVGQPSPQAAVESFLRAVYLDQNPAKVATLVCQAARDPKKIAAKIAEVKQQDQQYDSPKYSWGAPTTEHSGSARAVLSTTVTLTTANVQQASQKLTFTLIRSTGWFVCDVKGS
jgi:hypothetical protein